MPENGKQSEKRECPRIARNFIVKHRPQGQADAEWDTCFIKNISLKGCYCSSSRSYDEGEFLELQIRLPTLPQALSLVGVVKRCSMEKGKPISLYDIAVEFMDLDDNQKHFLNETVAFFVQKQQKN